MIGKIGNRLLSLVRRARQHLGSLGLLAGVGLAAWSFQVYQAAIDQQQTLAKSDYRWIAPGLLSADIILVVAVGVLLAKRLRSEISDGETSFPDSILRYAQRLSREGRHRALLRLRRDESLTLHILGAHEERIALGHLAFQSAAILSRDLDRAAVLIDDLGWAHYLIGHETEALQNIGRGKEIAAKARQESLPGTQAHQMARVLEARAIRHMVVINAAHPTVPINDWLDSMGEAAELLAPGNVSEDDLILQERAQLDHSKALGVALYLKINKTGTLSPTDTEGRQLVNLALASLTESEKSFAGLDDDARLAKALLLRERLLDAIGDKIGSMEAKAKAESAIADSAWMEAGGIQDILGPTTP